MKLKFFAPYFVFLFFTLMTNNMHLYATDYHTQGNVMSYKSVFNSLSKKKLLRSLKKISILRNIESVEFSGIYTNFYRGKLLLNNLRIKSDTTSLDDYISLTFIFDLETLNFIFSDILIYDNVGVYYKDECLFSKNVNNPIVLEKSNTTFSSDILHSISVTSNDEFYMNIPSGTVLTIRTVDPTTDFYLYIKNPDGSNRSVFSREKASNWTTSSIVFFQSGRYIFHFEPIENSSVSLQFGFTNNNRNNLRSLKSGDNINSSLNGWGHEYAKYTFELNRGDLVEITNPSDNDIYLYLLDSYGMKYSSGNGKVYCKVPVAGTYYLFIVNTDYKKGSSYNGSLTITPDPDSSKYPILKDIGTQFCEKDSPCSFSIEDLVLPENSLKVIGLPPGLSLNSSSSVNGAPTLSGIFPVDVYKKNEYGIDTKSFILNITDSHADGNGKITLDEIIKGLKIITGGNKK